MKIEDKKDNVISNFEAEEIGFEIGNQDIVLGILFDKLYTDKILVPVQEYLSNARDAMREAKNTHDKVQVTLPTAQNPVLKIRDFGPGLSPERVKKVFVKTGNSTKRDSNEQTGGFGIGAKSGFAYSGHFIVTSYFDGKKTEYLADISEVKSGSLKVLNESETNEKNGVEIQIPLKSVEDIYRFEEAVFKTVAFWGNERPEIKNLTPAEHQHRPSRKLYDTIHECIYENPRVMIYNAKGTFSYSMSANFKVVVDGIIYPLPDSPEIRKDLEAYIQVVNFYDKHTYLLAQVGELEISASRESLQASQKTIEGLKKIIEDAKNWFLKDFNSAALEVNTLVEAKAVVKKFGPLVAHKASFAKRQIEGLLVDLSNGRIEDSNLKQGVVSSFGWRSIRYNTDISNAPNLRAQEVIYIDREYSDSTIKGKIASYGKIQLKGQKGKLEVLIIPFCLKDIAEKLSAKPLTEILPKVEREKSERQKLGKDEVKVKMFSGQKVEDYVLDLKSENRILVLVEDRLQPYLAAQAYLDHVHGGIKFVLPSKGALKKIENRAIPVKDLPEKIEALLSPAKIKEIEKEIELQALSEVGFSMPLIELSLKSDQFMDEELKAGFKSLEVLATERKTPHFMPEYGVYASLPRENNYFDLFQALRGGAESVRQKGESFLTLIKQKYPLLLWSGHLDERIFYANAKHQAQNK